MLPDEYMLGGPMGGAPQGPHPVSGRQNARDSKYRESPDTRLIQRKNGGVYSQQSAAWHPLELKCDCAMPTTQELIGRRIQCDRHRSQSGAS